MGAAPARSAPPGLDASERRVLNPRPFRVFRKTYSVTEAKAGAAVVVLLALVAAWVAWRGAHPDPSLVADPATPTAPAEAPVALSAAPARSAPDAVPSVPPVAPDRGNLPVAPDRGVLPAALAGKGWSEGPLARFDAENLYVKINGRADFFLARGFRSLTFVTLSGPAGAVVDVELYDLGSPENALGAFSAEKTPEAKPKSGGGTSWYVARNALFVARGASYVRAIGSDESPAVVAQLEHLRKTFEGGIAAGEKPWTVALFGDALGLPPDRLQYTAESAFSFGFARNVSSATLDDGETELFVLPAGDEGKAKALSAQFEKGFLSYGEKAVVAGEPWIKDRYLGAFSRAKAAGTFVVGVRGGPEVAKAAEALAKLERAVLALSPDVAKKAAAGPPTAAKGDADE
ncbi:MAG: hypothetical protein IPP07_13610 [Holophagales bacterium]|nr:hypothetical protein [Holophagales bacterium]